MSMDVKSLFRHVQLEPGINKINPSQMLARAESGRQCGDDPPHGNFHAELSSNGSCQNRRALELMDAGGL